MCTFHLLAERTTLGSESCGPDTEWNASERMVVTMMMKMAAVVMMKLTMVQWLVLIMVMVMDDDDGRNLEVRWSLAEGLA